MNLKKIDPTQRRQNEEQKRRTHPTSAGLESSQQQEALMKFFIMVLEKIILSWGTHSWKRSTQKLTGQKGK